MAARDNNRTPAMDTRHGTTEEEVDDEHDAKDRVLQRYFLQEWKLVKSLLDDIVSNGGVSDPSSVRRIRSILDKYQEQGQLVEPYLESIVSPLMCIIRSRMVELRVESNEILEIVKPISIIIYSLVTVCGYKAVIKFFPHQVADLELAVSLLENCHSTSSSTSLRQESSGETETKCVVLLWLSILVLVPFDISTVDTSIANNNLGENELAPLVLRILGISKDYLCSAGPMRTISGLLLSRLLTRPDMPKAFASFVQWTHEVLISDADDGINHFRVLGVVEALAALFKTGSRKALMDVIPTIWDDIAGMKKSATTVRSPLLRKYLIKLTQRIALTCLPRRSASWRYRGGTSYFHINISTDASQKANQNNHAVCNNPSVSEQRLECPEDEDMDVPEIIEDIIEMLLSGLRDTDTVVRWSAAKGIGRVTSRLTSLLSEEVLSSVLELFSPGEGDGSWHGGCLALAELARRGLLLPRSLSQVVPVIIKALHYDVRRGPHSVGSHVRDAAAYVCWAFGRAYYESDMRKILEQLAPHLLTVGCYDREVNCRRAAAAAFQENVGRQGNFPHGIDIVTIADYFSLSSRAHSYLQVAVCIAQYEGYLQPFVDELLNNKICHWDKGLRELAAEALAALVKFDPEYFGSFVLEKLIPFTLSSDICSRHGATLATGEVVLAMHQCGYILSSDKQKRVAGVVPAIEKARLYRGKGGEIMRSAVSRFIECISSSHVLLSEKIKQSLLDTLNENLRHPNSQIQNAAVNAVNQFVQSYLVSTEGKASIDIVSKYLGQLTDPNVAVRRGSALALGVLPYEFLATRWQDVLLKLCSACAIEENPEDRDAEARVNAVKGLTSVCETLTKPREPLDMHLGGNPISLFIQIKDMVMNSLLKALDDYSVDNRGDVGSWVREAALDGLERCTYILCKKDKEMPGNGDERTLFDPNLATSLIGVIVKQAVEKMDKLREAAAKTLQRVLYNKTIFIPFIPFRENLEKIVPYEANLKWAVPVFSYPRFVQLLKYRCYSKTLLSGLVVSVGGLQDSLRKASVSALLDYLQVGEGGDLNERRSREQMFSEDILYMLQEYKNSDRVMVPTLKSIEILFSNKIFLNTEALTPNFYGGILDSLSTELKASKDFAKLYAGISILGYIASVSEPINTKAFSQLLTFLGHRYPKIRKAASEQVYLVLLQNSVLVAEDKLERALEIISGACWEGDLESTKPQRFELCELTGQDPALLLKTNTRATKAAERRPPASDENASYSSLVESTGF